MTTISDTARPLDRITRITPTLRAGDRAAGTSALHAERPVLGDALDVANLIAAVADVLQRWAERQLGLFQAGGGRSHYSQFP